MELTYEDEVKENTFHSSHTNRHSYKYGVRVFSLSVDRPETKENDLITRYYCEFDNYLKDNNQKVDHVSDHREWIPLTLSQEEVVEQLEAVCVQKSTEYNNWENTSSVTYSVPSTYEVDEIFEKRESAIKVSLVDGKLYDRDLIYRYSALSHSWLPVCPRIIAQPVFKAMNGKVDATIVPLTLASITTQYHGYKDVKENYKNKGFLRHNSPWELQYSLSVDGDVFIDLGQPQIVTHIGTIGSFIKTRLYPEYLNDPHFMVGRKLRQRRKLSQGITVEDDQCGQSWCVSYRLMYKRSAGDPYEYIGSYKANQNSYELVVNDLRSNLPSVPIRYLMLKPLSNKPRNFPLLSACRMCIALYGKAPEPKKSLLDGELKNEVQLIKYTLVIPPAKPVRFKQNHYSDYNRFQWGCRDSSGSKHILKQRQLNAALRDLNAFYERDDDGTDSDDNAEYLYLGMCAAGLCPICDARWGEEVCSAAVTPKSSAVIDTQLDDTEMWPPLPKVVATKGLSSVSGDVSEGSGLVDTEISASTSINASSSGSSYATMSVSADNDDDDWEYL